MNEKIKMFVVEDYFLTRISYKHFFTDDETIELKADFGCAEECLDVLERQTVDIILIDLGLPMMNGIELTKVIKERYPDIKCIILTSHESENEIMACLHSGARGYVLKDLELDKLRNVIISVYHGAYWFDPKIESVPAKTFPKPNSTDFNNLYPQSEIKQILTEREIEVLKLMVEGKSNPEIAEEIVVSTNTAKAHVCNILNKLSVTDRVQAAVRAVREKLF